MRGTKVLSTKEKLHLVEDMNCGMKRKEVSEKYNVSQKIIDFCLQIRAGLDRGNSIYAEFEDNVLSGTIHVSENDIRQLRLLSQDELNSVVQQYRAGNCYEAHSTIKRIKDSQTAKQSFPKDPKPRSSTDIFKSLLAGIMSSLDDQLNTWIYQQDLSTANAKAALRAIQNGKSILNKYEKFIKEEINYEEK